MEVVFADVAFELPVPAVAAEDGFRPFGGMLVKYMLSQRGGGGRWAQ